MVLFCDEKIFFTKIRHENTFSCSDGHLWNIFFFFSFFFTYEISLSTTTITLNLMWRTKKLI